MASEHSFDHTNASEDLDKAISGMKEDGGGSAWADKKKNQKSGRKSKNTGSKKKKKKDPKQATRKLWVAILSLLIVVIGVGSIIGAGLTVVHTQLDKVTKVQVNRKALGINSRVAKELKNYRNIALLGIDARDMSDDSQTRSDAMIIASINKETNEVKLVSLYRDTYVSLGDDYCRFF